MHVDALGQATASNVDPLATPPVDTPPEEPPGVVDPPVSVTGGVVTEPEPDPDPPEFVPGAPEFVGGGVITWSGKQNAAAVASAVCAAANAAL
jgi:hypothetical protein